MQPGVVPGAVYEFHAAKAAGGLSPGSPGVNSPLTTPAFDTSGSGNHGVPTNFAGTLASGYAGSGTAIDPYRLVLDGTDDYLEVADAAELRPGTGDFTAEIEVLFPITASVSWAFLFGKGASASPLAGAWGFGAIGAVPLAVRFADFYDDSGLNVNILLDLTSGYHRLAVTRTSGVYQFYVDGAVSGDPVTPAHIADLNSTDPLRIGRCSDERFLATAVPLARLYPFALTAEQVAQNYAVGTAWTDDLTFALEAVKRSTSDFILFDGNSITYGEGAVHGVSDYPTQSLRLLPGKWVAHYPFANGANTTSLIANAPTFHDAYASSDHLNRFVVFLEGINSMSASQDPAQEVALWHTYCDARRAAGFDRIIVCTIPAGNEPGRNGYAIAQGYASWDEMVKAFNVLLRAGYSEFADGLADVGADPILGDVANCGDGIYFSDQIHLLPAGYAIMARIVAEKLGQMLNPATDAKLDAVLLKTNTIGGAGAIAWPYTLTVNGMPCADAAVWVTTDEAGNNVVASGRTDDFGALVPVPKLDAGTYYFWAKKSGVNFNSPDIEVIV